MLSTTDLYEDCARRIKTKVTFNNQTTIYGDGIDGAVISIKFVENMESSAGLSCGSTPTSETEIDFRMPTESITLNNGYVRPYVGIEDDGDITWTPLGKFNITEIKTTNSYQTVKIKALDDMYWLDKKLDGNLIAEGTGVPPLSQNMYYAKDIIASIAHQCNIQIADGELDKFPYTSSLAIKLRDDTCKTFLSYAAGLIGTNARFNRDGALEFIYYSKDDIQLTVAKDIQYLDGNKLLDELPTTIQSVSAGDNSNDYSYGAGVGFVYHCPDITQEQLDAIAPNMIGITYTPLTLKWRGNPNLQCGDRVKVIGRDNAEIETLVMQHTLVVAGGMYDTIKCYVLKEKTYSGGYKYSPTTRAIQRVYTDLQEKIYQSTAFINGAKGGIFSVYDSDNDGINDGFIIADNHDLSSAHKYIRANHEGIGLSTDGGHTYTTAMTPEGINANAITTGELDAQRVTVGNETLGDVFNVELDNDGHPVVTIGSSNSEIRMRQMNNKLAFVDSTGRVLAYFSNNSFEIIEMRAFRLDRLKIQELTENVYGFIGVAE